MEVFAYLSGAYLYIKRKPFAQSRHFGRDFFYFLTLLGFLVEFFEGEVFPLAGNFHDFIHPGGYLLHFF